MIEITPTDVADLAPEFSELSEDTHDTQLVSFDGEPAAGSFSLNVDDENNVTVAHDSDAGSVQDDIRAIEGYEEVTVEGDFVDGFTITFEGILGPVNLMTADTNTLEDDEGSGITVTTEKLLDGEESQIRSIIPVAREFVSEDKWGGKAKHAICLMTAHLLKELGFDDEGSQGTQAAGPLVSKKVGDVSRQYAQITMGNSSVETQLLLSTKYGRSFLALRKTLVITPMVL